ncbi:MAG: hypothetical protein WCT19_04360 [Candidatus Paceibacterota bacterium]|jgi:hypothetical protein
MKTVYNITSLGLLGAVLFGLGTPVFSYAQTASTSISTTTGTTAVSSPGSNNFCANVDKFDATEDQKLVDGIANYEKIKVTRTQVLNQNYASRDAQQEIDRDNFNVDTDAGLAALQELAQTDAEKKAVVSFGQIIGNAVSARRKAVDAAVKSFRSGLDQAINTRKANIDNYLAAFKSAIDGIISKAKTDCANGVDQSLIKKNMQDGIKSARKVFSDSIVKLDKVSVTISTLLASRKSAFDKAHQDFNLALTKAKTDLEATFK